MDLTPMFKKLVVSIKDGDVLSYGLECLEKDECKSRKGKISKRAFTQTKEFALKAKKLVGTISKMKNFLLDNRKDYINLYSPLLSQASPMSDDDRDRIDSDVYLFMRNSNEIIRALRTEIGLLTGVSAQVKEHQEAMVELIQKYLKLVCDIYSEQKAIRVKRACDKQKFSRLETISGIESRSSVDGTRQESSSRSHSLADPDLIPEETSTQPDRGLSVEELQTYEEENLQLYDELNAVTDEVRQIEGKVVEIARLQEIFTEKVLQQEQDLNRVNTTVINSTEDIRGGNEELRKAMKENAGFRVWLLFYIITLTFTILFLDWYNP